jgi:hypothetical protein
MIVMNLVMLKGAAENELLFNKPAARALENKEQ